MFANDVLVKGLKDVYLSKVKPVEMLFKFDAVYGPCLSEADFDSVPNVLLLGKHLKKEQKRLTLPRILVPGVRSFKATHSPHRQRRDSNYNYFTHRLGSSWLNVSVSLGYLVGVNI